MDTTNVVEGCSFRGRVLRNSNERKAVRQSVLATLVFAALMAAGVAGLSLLGVQLPDDGVMLAMNSNGG